MSSALYTYGYEGLDIETFVNRLNSQDVKIVVDVRELPLSRKKGFSKKSFSSALHDGGIAYVHMPALGCPRGVRNAYREDGDWQAYARKFLSYLAEQKEAVRELAKLSKGTTACLVCFEADYNYCHRSLVARAVALVSGVRVLHLTAKTEIPEVIVKVAA